MPIPRRYELAGLTLLVVLAGAVLALAGEMFFWGPWPQGTPVSWRLPHWLPARERVNAWQARRDASAAEADGRRITFGYGPDGTGLDLPESCRVVGYARQADDRSPVPPWFRGLRGSIEIECRDADGVHRATFTNVEMGCIPGPELQYALAFNREMIRLALREE